MSYEPYSEEELQDWANGKKGHWAASTEERRLAQTALDALMQLRRYCAGDPPKVEISEEERQHIRAQAASQAALELSLNFDGIGVADTFWRWASALRMLQVLESVERERTQLLAVARDIHGEAIVNIVQCAQQLVTSGRLALEELDAGRIRALEQAVEALGTATTAPSDSAPTGYNEISVWLDGLITNPLTRPQHIIVRMVADDNYDNFGVVVLQRELTPTGLSREQIAELTNDIIERCTHYAYSLCRPTTHAIMAFGGANVTDRYILRCTPRVAYRGGER